MEKSKVIYLKVPFVKSVFDYMCSENTVSMYLAYYKKKISPETIQNYIGEMSCYHIFSIHKCLSKILKDKYIVIKSNLKFTTIGVRFTNIVAVKYTIQKFIDNKEPLIASIIPDTNWADYLSNPNKDIQEFYHTILIVGYIKGTQTILKHDQGPFEKMDLYDFIRQSARTNHVFVIKEKYLSLFPKSFTIPIRESHFL